MPTDDHDLVVRLQSLINSFPAPYAPPKVVGAPKEASAADASDREEDDEEEEARLQDGAAASAADDKPGHSGGGAALATPSPRVGGAGIQPEDPTVTALLRCVPAASAATRARRPDAQPLLRVLYPPRPPASCYTEPNFSVLATSGSVAVARSLLLDAPKREAEAVTAVAIEQLPLGARCAVSWPPAPG